MPKIGVEIHQRLDTAKLFCSCPSPDASLETPLNYDFIVRRLHTTRSETGEVDRAASQEVKKGKTSAYFYNDEHCCLVEMDEEPPHEINREALLVALNVAQQMGMAIFDKAVVMRKLVVDGSNTSGFQRTALLAIDGKIETSEGSVGIQTLCIEEESAGILKDGEFRVDRLGIPLIEIATSPDIKEGKHVREVCEKIGLILRSTGKAARGIGTIRQDLNVSIEEGARVEIKGAQELNMLEKWVSNEIKRQRDLLKIIDELRKRNAYSELEKIHSLEMIDETEIFKKAKAKFIQKAIEAGGKALAIKLPKHAGILGQSVGTRRYGSELSDYAKAKAGVGGIIHSDEDLSKYGLEANEINELLKDLNNDALIVVVANEEKAKQALMAVIERAKMDFVPEETRKALPDGGSAYMRPLPGAARMYPETDVPYIEISNGLLSESKKLAKSFDEKKEELKSLLKNDELVNKMLRSKRLALFEKLIGKGHEPKIVAITLEDTLTKLRREGIEATESVTIRALDLYKDGKITKKGIEKAIYLLSEGKSENEILKEIGKMSKKDVAKLLKDYDNNIKAILRDYSLRVDPAELKAIMEGKYE